MHKLQKLLIIICLMASILPVYYLNKWLQRVIQPRRSFGRLMGYILLGFALVFVYSFLVVYIISNLFPLPKR